jgi:hypothetical protein
LFIAITELRHPFGMASWQMASVQCLFYSRQVQI